jgi:uncharacterized membrane protein YfcA
MAYWLLYVGLGGASGLLAGLLGVGGGVVLVPALVVLFAAQHVPATFTLHLALGTSLASIAFTSVASLRAHHGRGAVDWRVFRGVTPGILLGTTLGTWIAAQLPGRLLEGVFVAFLFFVAAQLLLDVRPRPSRQLPGAGGLFGAGSLIGGVSSLVGIGGGSMSVPFLVWCNVSVRNAIGTSAAIGFPIAVAGAVGYVANGLAVTALPAHSVGFVHVPALLGIAAAGVLTAPLGARLAHRLPVAHLKRIFALLLVAMGTKMLAGLVAP